MARTLDEDELVGNWTLVGDELALLSNRRAPTKLAFALMLRFYALHGRFPKGRHELPDQAVGYVARLVKVGEADLALYEWDGRTSKEHRKEIRDYFGFRECGLADSDKAALWLAANVCDKERHPDRVREALLAHLWENKLEQPAPDRIRRIIGSAISQAEKSQTALIASRVPQEAVARMLALIAHSADPGAEEDSGDQDEDALFDAAEVTGVDLFTRIREEPGNVSVKTIEREVFKLRAIKAVGLPEGLFADVAPKILASWRARVAAEAPSHLRSHPRDIQVTLLAAYLYCRGREITDTLVDLLITTVHRINAHAETKVVGDFVAELKRVSGKENILFKMTEAALEAPTETVEEAIYPAVPGGYKTLVQLLHEYKAKGSSYRQHKQRVFKASNHYRTGLIQIIEALEFGSTNTVHAPMMTALALIKRYKAEAGSNRVKCYALGEQVPVEGIIPAELVELLYRADSKRRQRILRSVYECGVFQTLREKLRCKEIWVVGAERWRNPDDDLPRDYEQRRAENYAKLRKPLDPQVFIEEMRSELDYELSQLNDALGGKGLRWLKISDRKSGAITLTPLDAAPEPINLRRLKAAIRAKWGMVPLMDMLAETALRTKCLQALTPVGVQHHLDEQALFERLLLVIYAYGTGTGIRAAAAGDHNHSEDDLRYVRRRFLTVEGCREVARIIANATFTARHTSLWGEGTSSVASDSTHFSAWDQNIFTECSPGVAGLLRDVA